MYVLLCGLEFMIMIIKVSNWQIWYMCLLSILIFAYDGSSVQHLSRAYKLVSLLKKVDILVWVRFFYEVFVKTWVDKSA